MRRLFLCVCVLGLLHVAPWMQVPQAAISVVQQISGSSNDVLLTFGSAMTASNHIVVAAILAGDGATADITGITNPETVLHGPEDLGTLTGYLWCFTGEADTQVTVTTSAAIVARASAVEITGGSCTEDGTSLSNLGDATSPYAIALTTSQAGSILVGFIEALDTSDYSAAGSTSAMPATGTDIGGAALGGYVICGAAGSCQLDWSSAAGETSHLIAASVRASVAVTPKGLLTGVFP